MRQSFAKERARPAHPPAASRFNAIIQWPSLQPVSRLKACGRTSRTFRTRSSSWPEMSAEAAVSGVSSTAACEGVLRRQSCPASSGQGSGWWPRTFISGLADECLQAFRRVGYTFELSIARAFVMHASQKYARWCCRRDEADHRRDPFS